MDPNFRRSDRHRVLLALTAYRSPTTLTTLELSQHLQLDVHRVAGVVHLLVEEHVLEHAVLKPDGWSWAITDIGTAELARLAARETGVPYRDIDPDEREINATLRRFM